MRNLTMEELRLVSGGHNNGWGNGEQESPGASGEQQPKFDDPNTGLTPASSPRSADFDR
jgi:hypothetical protein